MGGRMRLVAAALLVLGAGLRVTAEQPAPEVPKGGKEVLLSTSDGMGLAATHWHPASPSGAGAVLLHMYRRDRTTWHPLVEHLTARGMDVLAVDMRGHGGSAKQVDGDLADRVAERDATLFAEMHHDAYAAVRWLVVEAKCDAKRIGIAGASVGCSVAIDTVKRHPGEVAAVVCMTPGANYLGLPSLEHAKDFPGKCALLLMTHEEEADVGAKPLAAAVKHARLLVYDEKRPADVEDGWAHGTRMFGPIPLAEQTVASFLSARTGSKTDDVVLDGVVEDEAKPGGAWTKATAVPVEGKSGTAWAYRVGGRVAFGGTVEPPRRSVHWGIRVPAGVSSSLRRSLAFTIDLERRNARVTRTARELDPHEPVDPDLETRAVHEVPENTPPFVRVTRTPRGFAYEGEIGLEELADRPSASDPLVSVSVEDEAPPPRDPRAILDEARARTGVPIPSR